MGKKGKVEKDEDELDDSDTQVNKISYKGEPGPVHKRSCQDIFWLLLFIIFWIGFIVVGYFAGTKGDPKKLIFGLDSENALCGVDHTASGGRDLSTMPFVYYFEPLNITTTYARCVAECPPNNIDFSFIVLFPDPADAICKDDFVHDTNEQVVEGAENGDCVNPVFASADYLGRCFPVFVEDDWFNVTEETGAALNASQSALVDLLNAQGFSFMIYRDLYAQYQWIAASLSAAFIFSWCWLMLLQLCAGVMVWTSIILVLVFLGGGSAYCWWTWYELNNGIVEVLVVEELGVITNALISQVWNVHFFLALAIIMSILFLFIFLSLVFLRSRILLAVDIIKVASRAVRAMPFIILFPLVRVFFLGLVVAWSFWVVLNLITAGEVDTFEVDEIPFTYQTKYLLEYLQAYAVFGFFGLGNLWLLLGIVP
eukprot:Lithocolla_globosa_v1_NODE_1836_length_2305_cov_1.876444.p1 type:complete len:426 gc:universal NODE_1836_length_2305_cov_1.876444:183-1460(+)